MVPEDCFNYIQYQNYINSTRTELDPNSIGKDVKNKAICASNRSYFRSLLIKLKCVKFGNLHICKNYENIK